MSGDSGKIYSHPSGDAGIADGAFDGCTSLIAIYGPGGGSTQEWARNHQIPFIRE